MAFTDRPLPPSDPTENEAFKSHLAPALYSTEKRAPLWSTKEDVPDMIRDHIKEDTICTVNTWVYDVFVDFIVLSSNMFFMEQIHKDLLLILRTFHNRSQSGASNLKGWFYQSISGAPQEIASQLDSSIAARTITWRLQQSEADAFPSLLMEKIAIDLHGADF